MSNILENCYIDQARFTRDFLTFLGYDPDNLSENDIVEIIRYYVLSLHKELSEVLDTVQWKLHKKDKTISKINFSELQVELIDVQKFLWGLMSIIGMNSDEVVNGYTMKSKLVQSSWEKFKGAQV